MHRPGIASMAESSGGNLNCAVPGWTPRFSSSARLGGGGVYEAEVDGGCNGRFAVGPSLLRPNDHVTAVNASQMNDEKLIQPVVDDAPRGQPRRDVHCPVPIPGCHRKASASGLFQPAPGLSSLQRSERYDIIPASLFDLSPQHTLGALAHRDSVTSHKVLSCVARLYCCE
jgi:hypothetical protein